MVEFPRALGCADECRYRHLAAQRDRALDLLRRSVGLIEGDYFGVWDEIMEMLAEFGITFDDTESLGG